jgi:hypothetical protein
VLRFSNECSLRIHINAPEVIWDVAESVPPLECLDVERVGSPSVLCQWRPGVGDHVMDRSALVSKRRGSVFKQLFVNEMGLLVYFRGHAILWFCAVRHAKSKEPLLYVTEGD